VYRRWTTNLWTVFVLILYFGLVGRLFYIQILQKSKYQNLAQNQSTRKKELLAERGSIYDCNFNTLARDIDKYSIGVNPTHLKNKNQVAKIMAKFTANSYQYYRNLLKKKKFVWLARGVEQETNKKIKFDKPLPIKRLNQKGRFYPYGKAAANVIGFTSIDNDGLTGIEKTYNDFLEGEAGFRLSKVDAHQKVVPAFNVFEKTPIDGKSIVLTININYQRIAEDALKRGLAKYGAKGGTVVMMNPSTAEVLAMVSYPSFNPNNYSAYSKSEQRNRTIVDPYEPGSTFKFITAAAALEEGILAPLDKINCENGRMMFPGGPITDHKKYGILTFRQVFAYSSNIGFAKIAQKVNKQRIFDYGRKFGFGTQTRIDLIGEDRGKFKNSVFWSESDFVRIAIGYGVMTTALQLTNAYAAIANGGYLYKPRIVKTKISGSNPDLYEETKSEMIRQVLSPKTIDQLKSFMLEVVKSGTGKSAAIEGIEIAGKTGTTKKYDPALKKYSSKKYIASFVGMTPVKTPKLVCLVVVDEPDYQYKYGQQSAAPIFREIILKVQDSIQEPQKGVKKVSNPQNNDSKIRVPNIVGIDLQEAKTILTNQFKIRTEGDGSFVRNQLPNPGTLLNSGEVVKLVLGAKSKKSKLASKVPNVVGKSIREAIEILTQAGFDPVPKGSGYVIKQTPKPNTNSYNRQCQIVCQPITE